MQSKNMKFAYLILAHGNYVLLKELLKALDSPDNDIYVHLDKKAGHVEISQFEDAIRYSKLVFIKNRVDVKWGHISIVEATLNLLEEAVKCDYDYLHLLSGVDFPIKSHSYIQNFFQEHKGCEFVGYSNDMTEEDVKKRIVWYPFHRRDYRRKYIAAGWLNGLSYRVQKILHLYTVTPLHTQRIGSEWFSITWQLANDLVSQKKRILKRYKHVLVPDEMFMQAFLIENDLMEKVYDGHEEFGNCCRKIDWSRGNPYVWQEKDFEELVNSPCLWARKFSEDQINLVKKIAKHIKE